MRLKQHTPIPPRCLRAPDAAPCIGVSPRTLASRSWRIRNRVPALRVGMCVVYDPVALLRWLRSHPERPHSPGKKSRERRTEGIPRGGRR